MARFGEEGHQLSFAEQRFLLYDVNPGEGFNLRRDVYMRMANAVRQLRERGHDFVLVLLPWSNIWHWQRRDVQIPWAELFDLDTLGSFVPVMEFDEFLQRNGAAFSVDQVLYLQHYAEGWSEQEGFVNKYDVRPCLNEAGKFYTNIGSIWEKQLLGRKFQTTNFRCLSIQGQSSTLADAIIELFPKSRSIMVERAETILHDHFGDVFYWRARESMRYASHLRKIGDQFRRQKFGPDAVSSPSSNRPSGNFICAHLRRADFVWAHKEDVPSLEGAANQMEKLAKKLNMNRLFLCTDAKSAEVNRLTEVLTANGLRVERFGAEQQQEEGEETPARLSDAAISIIDQWICAHASHFIGTHHSTFSLRIHEDREILGFPPESTFNRFCADGQQECEQPSKWTIQRES